MSEKNISQMISAIKTADAPASVTNEMVGEVLENLASDKETMLQEIADCKVIVNVERGDRQVADQALRQEIEVAKRTHPVSTEKTDDGTLILADEDGNDVVTFADGHVRTANFDSADTVLNLDVLRSLNADVNVNDIDNPAYYMLSGFRRIVKGTMVLGFTFGNYIYNGTVQQWAFTQFTPDEDGLISWSSGISGTERHILNRTWRSGSGWSPWTEIAGDKMFARLTQIDEAIAKIRVVRLIHSVVDGCRTEQSSCLHGDDDADAQMIYDLSRERFVIGYGGRYYHTWQGGDHYNPAQEGAVYIATGEGSGGVYVFRSGQMVKAAGDYDSWLQEIEDELAHKAESTDLAALSQVVDRIEVQENSRADLIFAADDGSPIATFSDGHIATANFDSASVDSRITTGLNEMRDEVDGRIGQLQSDIEDARLPISMEDAPRADLILAADDGTAIATFVEGHIVTANFDSSNIQTDIELPIDVVDAPRADLVLAAEDGTAIATFVDGHIVTANFDSSNIDTDVELPFDVVDAPRADLVLAAEDGTAIATFVDGHIVTANFDSSNIQASGSNAPSVELPYEGKKLSIIGDSISTFSNKIHTGYASYYPQGDVMLVSQTWWYKVAQLTGMEVLSNCSWSASKTCGDSTDTTGVVGCGDGRIAHLASGGVSPDVVLIMIGVNDWQQVGVSGQSIAPGSWSMKSSVPSGTIMSFAEAYALMIIKIRRSYPNAQIFCCTFLDTKTSIHNGNAVEDFNSVIRSLCNILGTTLVDAHSCGIGYFNYNNFFLSDGIHPNAAGMEMIAKRVAQIINNN